MLGSRPVRKALGVMVDEILDGVDKGAAKKLKYVVLDMQEFDIAD